MTRFYFDAGRGLIRVPIDLAGPERDLILMLAVDTGATRTVVNYARLREAGYDPAISDERISLTTASGVEYSPRLSVTLISALGIVRPNFAVIAHTLPAGSGVDGLLGLDFFSDHRLVIDLAAGFLEVTRP